MRCKEFDTHIDDLLLGVQHPEAAQHLRQCERCVSHFHARASVHNALRKLASAPAVPSDATDRAVMESYRRFQQRVGGTPAIHEVPRVRDAVRDVNTASPASLSQSEGKLRGMAPVTSNSRRWFSPALYSPWVSGAAAAAVVFAVLGSLAHLSGGAGTVNAPVSAPIASAPTTSAQTVQPQPTAPQVTMASAASPATARRAPHTFNAPRNADATQMAAMQPVRLSTKPAGTTPVALNESADSTPVLQLPAGTPPVIHLASTGSSGGNMAQSASSTWPGYSNLMYCDPVVCSGPMQVVHVKVPVEQVKPSVGQSGANTFVNADVVIGPDGVARAIRIPN